MLQHAHNPVDWFAWGDEALQKAKLENKLLLISIGYSACHWCHVMEHESFENSEVAQMMNASFVCIKVDREERPDIDQVYMELNLKYSPNLLFAVATSESEIPIFAQRFVQGKTLIYVCMNNTCKLPVQSVSEALKSINPTAF